MDKKFDWKEFLRITLGVFLIGIGISVVGGSGGKVSLLIVGFGLAAIGLGLILTQ